ncbi:MAG: histidine--tRNA ligase, partial [Alphaproteobacteria bacterium]|nr:histidine--tRNA ligase [Alphaproteobacteria bacterium]
DSLPLHFDAEMPAIIWEVLSSLPGMENEKIQIRVSNRKILLGFLDSLGIRDTLPIIRIIDKKDKIGEQDTLADLLELGLRDRQLEQIIELYDVKATKAEELHSQILDILTRHSGESRNPSASEETQTAWTPASAGVTALFEEGIKELSFVLDQLSHLPEGAVVADLSIVRGLDYYTGTVYETVFTDDPGYGSICSGGRYDDLAGGYINKHLPGVGISIGFSRLFDRLRQQGKLPVKAKSAADILMVLPSEETRADAAETARTLRGRGFNVELYHAPQKVKKQLSYAERKGIPYIWFPPFESGRPHEVKNMATGEQTQADPDQWCPNE